MLVKPDCSIQRGEARQPVMIMKKIIKIIITIPMIPMILMIPMTTVKMMT